MRDRPVERSSSISDQRIVSSIPSVRRSFKVVAVSSTSNPETTWPRVVASESVAKSGTTSRFGSRISISRASGARPALPDRSGPTRWPWPRAGGTSGNCGRRRPPLVPYRQRATEPADRPGKPSDRRVGANLASAVDARPQRGIGQTLEGLAGRGSSSLGRSSIVQGPGQELPQVPANQPPPREFPTRGDPEILPAVEGHRGERWSPRATNGRAAAV